LLLLLVLLLLLLLVLLLCRSIDDGLTTPLPLVDGCIVHHPRVLQGVLYADAIRH
jgi:hypothetical protein